MCNISRAGPVLLFSKFGQSGTMSLILKKEAVSCFMETASGVQRLHKNYCVLTGIGSQIPGSDQEPARLILISLLFSINRDFSGVQNQRNRLHYFSH